MTATLTGRGPGPDPAAPAEAPGPLGEDDIRPPSGRTPWWRRAFRRGALGGWADAITIVGVVVVALSQLHPDLLVANTTTSGGDTGAHVMLPAFLKSNLLPHGRLTGWDPGWYDGYPLYTFYFPLPGVVTVLFSTVLSYDVAFKFTTVLGSVLLPLCAWAFGRLTRLPNPGPACLAAATLPFLFEPSFTIYGGNLLSTLAGEYAFSLSLSFGLLFLGVWALMLRTGRHRALAAVLFAVTLLCHLVPAMFVAAAAVVWLLLDADVVRSLRRGVAARAARARWGRRLWWSVLVGIIGLGLTAWWSVPFALEQAYTTNMGYTKVVGYVGILFPASAYWLLALDLVALVALVVRRNRVGLFLAIMAALSAAAVILDPANKLYNARFLPFWFLCLYLLGGYAFYEVAAWVVRLTRRRRLDRWVGVVRDRLFRLGGVFQSASTEGRPPPLPWRSGVPISRHRRPESRQPRPGRVAVPLLALVAACVAVVPSFALPASTLARLDIHPGASSISPGANVSAWAEWNYSGYQGKPDYPEYKAVIDLMARVGADHGCGRTMWEYDPSLNRFGTTMSLMLLPYWTNGCIDSMEGLLFESSTTTPFHFLNQSELSDSPSDAVVGLPYGGLDVTLGIQHLQMLGVRYLLASSPDVQRAAAADPAARLVGQTGPWRTSYNGEALDTTWKVYEIGGSSLVEPLPNRPVVWDDVSPTQGSWLTPAVSWYLDTSRWGVVPAAGGPSSWPRVPTTVKHPAAVPEPATTVSDVRVSDNRVSFHVDRTGTPVAVKISYFPNWQASGAEGPWRLAPNLMVVVPTSHDVVLTYGTSSADRLGQVLTLLAVAGAVLVAVLEHRRRRRARSTGAS